jgi:hypothetical protein
MRGTGIEKKEEICATNTTNKTKCMCTHAKKWKNVMFSRIPDDGKSPRTQ